MQAKNQLHPHAFLEILQRYVNLFCALWACLVAHTQNDSINLYKNLMFIYIINNIYNIAYKMRKMKAIENKSLPDITLSKTR